MPSQTPKQHRAMEGAAHNPEFARKVGIPPNVAREFVMADVGRKFGPAKPAKPQGKVRK